MRLLLTLGHNASAIGIDDDGNIIAGYEEERLNREKSSSKFPKESILEIFKQQKPEKDGYNVIYVSHWFDNYEFKNTTDKHWDKDFISMLEREYNFQVISLNHNFTHHDAHLYSVLEFYKNGTNTEFTNGHVIVADGFGNKQEVYTLYYIDERGTPKKVFRNYSLKNSLGLMYQYATSFVGMKENQDEYKFLGYEAHIEKYVSPDALNIIEEHAQKIVERFEDTHSLIYNPSSSKDSEINVNALTRIKNYWYSIYQNLINDLALNKDDTLTFRAAIGYFIQTIIQNCNKFIIEEYNIKKLLVAGGIFYNVKLNNFLMNIVDEFSVIPLAGDQGAAIGLYVKKSLESFPFGDLCYGKRDLSNGKKFDNGKDIRYFDDQKKMEEFITNELKNDNIVEVVTGNMEFGPRALCHTSTIMLPTNENVMFINGLNKRNTIMPMAPIIRKEDAEYFYNKKDLDKVKLSDEYMIITYKYNDDVPYDKYSGVMHYYSGPNYYTGRPQFIVDKNSYIYNVLTELSDSIDQKALVNTSFNYHGVPIVRTVVDAVDDFMKQKENLEEYLEVPEYKNKKITLVIGDF